MENRPYAYFDRTMPHKIIVALTGEAENQENFQTYLDGLAQNFELSHYVLVIDVTHAPIPKMSYQRLQAQWMKANFNTIQEKCLAVSYIIPNPVLRNVLKFIFSLQRNPARYQVFDTLEEGERWAELHLMNYQLNLKCCLPGSR